MEATRSWQFGWLWAAYAISTFGTWIAFDALTMVAILMLHAGPTKVAIMAATGPAVGALIAVPLGPCKHRGPARRRLRNHDRHGAHEV